jgi:hypothetical protein
MNENRRGLARLRIPQVIVIAVVARKPYRRVAIFAVQNRCNAKRRRCGLIAMSIWLEISESGIAELPRRR